MKLKIASIFCISLVLLSYGCNDLTSESALEIVEFESDIFKNKRKIRVYLPKGYEKGNSFEVLYLNDGQNLFHNDSLESSDSWRVDRIADSLINLKQIRPIIIVGIDNPGLNERANEYLPWEDVYLTPPNPNPEGNKYPEFLSNELIPFINANYKTKVGRLNTGIGGFSYGGLISVFSALNTDNFGLLLIESPSLYVHEQKILAHASERQNLNSMKVYAGVGTNELNTKNCNETNVDNRMAVNDVDSLLKILRVNAPHSEFHFEVTKCGIHSYEEASKRLPIALEFLFGTNH